jgi:hypothetical protein
MRYLTCNWSSPVGIVRDGQGSERDTCYSVKELSSGQQVAQIGYDEMNKTWQTLDTRDNKAVWIGHFKRKEDALPRLDDEYDRHALT